MPLRCRDRGKASILDKTVSKRSGNAHLKNREAGVVPSTARQSKLCRTVPPCTSASVILADCDTVERGNRCGPPRLTSALKGAHSMGGLRLPLLEGVGRRALGNRMVA